MATNDDSIDRRIALRLKELRAQRSWSLEELAQRSGVSRASLSRLENEAVSPTASVLGRLCAVYGLPLSRLMYSVEDEFAPLVRRNAQAVWTDRAVGFHRRSVSPPARALAGEVLECTLEPATRIVYDAPPKPGLEHHLLLLEGALEVSVGGQAHVLEPGDCLRYQLHGASAFVTPEGCGARYLMFLV